MIPNDSIPPANDAGPPKGSLEDLFRHHLADAEVPPRPMVWEQLDTSLLVQQNELYRRRLAVTRWVAAASLLLATLASAGWWSRQTPAPLVAATEQPGGRAAVPGALNQAATSPAGAPASASSATGSAGGNANAGYSGADAPGADATTAARNGRSAAGALVAAAPLQAAGAAGYGLQPRPAPYAANTSAATPAGTTSALLAAGAAQGQESFSINEQVAYAATGTLASGALNNAAAARQNDDARGARPDWAAPAAPETPAAVWDALGLRVAALGAPGAPALPANLKAVAVASNEAVLPQRRWQFGGSYAVGVFYPNADFARDGGAAPAPVPYSTASSANALSLTNRSAAEYRNFLQGGLDQRLAVRASRLLGGHWALSTGVELGQHEAQSATSSNFVGEDLNPYALAAPAPATLRTTAFRYRTAGVPVEVRYADPTKRGWSLYGRAGAVVGALLGVRSEVDGEPEATKTYSLTAAGSPYRRLLTTLRGGAGVQYRPAVGHWTVSAGPTAEIGVLSLNAQPTQDFLQQRRPYSFGLEASVDFGGTAKVR